MHLASQIIQTALVVIHHHPQRLQQRLLQIVPGRTILFNFILPVFHRRRIALGPATHIGEVVVDRGGEGSVGALDDEGGEGAEPEAGPEVALGGVDECDPAVIRTISWRIGSKREDIYHCCDLQRREGHD